MPSSTCCYRIYYMICLSNESEKRSILTLKKYQQFWQNLPSNFHCPLSFLTSRYMTIANSPSFILSPPTNPFTALRFTTQYTYPHTSISSNKQHYLIKTKIPNFLGVNYNSIEAFRSYLFILNPPLTCLCTSSKHLRLLNPSATHIHPIKTKNLNLLLQIYSIIQTFNTH